MEKKKSLLSCRFYFPWPKIPPAHRIAVFLQQDQVLMSEFRSNWFCCTYIFSGFKFKDITTLLLNPKAFKNTVDLFVERYTGKDIAVVAGDKLIFQRCSRPILSFLTKFRLWESPTAINFCLGRNEKKVATFSVRISEIYRFIHRSLSSSSVFSSPFPSSSSRCLVIYIVLTNLNDP